MALVFLATQGVSLRHNDAVSDRHRPRLANHKIKSRPPPTASCRDYIQKETVYYDTQPDNFDDTLPQDYFFAKNDDVDVENSFVSDDDTSEDDFNDEEDKYCNNNNDLHYNLNKLNKSTYSLFGTPVEAFPSSLIKWPLDNSTKSKRLSNIRKQVRRLSSAIKMTIDSDDDQSPENKTRSNPIPFSSHVDMTLLQSFCSTTTSTTASEISATIEDLDAFLKTGRTKEAKRLIREAKWSVDHPIRELLWKTLIQHLSKETFTECHYWDTVQQLYGSKDMSECNVVLPAFVDQKLMTAHGLSAEGIKACERVISVVVYNCPAITYAPLIYPLTAILMHYMEEPEVYNCITTLVSKSSTFISQTKVLHESMWRTVEILARKHMRGSYSMLQKFGVTPEQVSCGFQHWTWWMFSHLPPSHLVRVLDCFFLEGSKVLLRCSLAVFHLFMKQAARDCGMATTLTTKGMTEAMAIYCQNIPVSPNKLLKTAFGIRAFSKNEIKKIVMQTEMIVKSDPCIGATSGPSSFLRSNSLEGLPTSESQENIQTMSHTLGIKEGSRSPLHRSEAISNCPIKHINSSVIVMDELLTIWSWIPMRMTMNHPKLVYTTEEHGSSLTNFYQRVGKHEPTLLLVRTTNDEVFGAYCSSAWSQRNQRDEYGHKQTYFGTGETFLFTLKPKPVRYEWVGITQQREKSGLSSVAHQSELFMHADHEMITVGGGLGHGLMLDQELQYGKTENCETFNNPPLCSTPDFQIKVVEVFSFGEMP